MTTMSARTNGTATSKRFELPALDFNFSSLTEGTDIPPPLPSPIAEEPVVKVPTPPMTPTTETTTATPPNGPTAVGTPDALTVTTTTTITSNKTGHKRSADPISPTGSIRPSSIRAEVDSIRPESRTSASVVTESGKKSKRTSGWFSKLRSHGDDKSTNGSPSAANKRASVMVLPQSNGSNSSMGPAEKTRRPVGPPPPMIPELSELKSKVDLNDGGSLGGDLFKDITIKD